MTAPTALWHRERAELNLSKAVTAHSLGDQAWAEHLFRKACVIEERAVLMEAKQAQRSLFNA